jgi:hypothetical protein
MKELPHSSGPTCTRDTPIQEPVEKHQLLASTTMTEAEAQDISETEAKQSIRIIIEHALKRCLNLEKSDDHRYHILY